MSKSKTYYFRDYKEDTLYTDLNLDHVKDLILHCTKFDIQFDVFEYGISESRGGILKLDKKFKVTEAFSVVNNKVVVRE